MLGDVAGSPGMSALFLGLQGLIKKYKVEIIAIGNGTASRETEMFIAEVIKENNLDCKYGTYVSVIAVIWPST